MANDSTSTVARLALFSLAVGLAVLALKVVAAWLTGSLALYSDALESTVNIVTAGVALVAVRLAARPADAALPYGYGKAEYFSAVLEGVLIVLAALAIVREAWPKLMAPEPIAELGAGMLVSLGASGLNALLGWWWADPLAALIMVPIIVREGLEGLHGEVCECQ